MKIYSWNVNGLRAIMSKNFDEFLAQEKPDILCLQETRLSVDLVDKMQVNFKYKHYHCAAKKGYSGTSIFSNIEPLDMKSISLENHPDEGRIVEADFGDFNLVCVYVPNSKSMLERLPYRENSWDIDFANYVNSLKKPTIVCGDLNVAHNDIDLARPKDNHFSAGFTDEERKGFSNLLEIADLADVWREFNKDVSDKYTWWSYRGGARSRNVGWRIDYFLATKSFLKNIKTAKICDDVLGSDHCPVSIEL